MNLKNTYYPNKISSGQKLMVEIFGNIQANATREPAKAVQTEDAACPSRSCGNAWGLSFGTSTGSVTNALDSKYLYNGKEQVQDLNIGLYEYGFRWYDAQIAKFVQVDPLADEYSYKSTYDYAENKPINAIDLDGLEKLVTIGVGGNLIFNSGMDRNPINYKSFHYNSNNLIPKKITQDSQWYKDLKDFFSGKMGIDIRGKGDNKFGATMNMGRDRTKDMKVVIMNLAEDNQISLLLDLHSAVTATPNSSNTGLGENLKIMADFLDKTIDQTISNHPIYTNSEFRPHESIKGGFYKNDEDKRCLNCDYSAPANWNGYNYPDFNNRKYAQKIFFPEYEKTNNGMESKPVYRSELILTTSKGEIIKK